MAKTRIKNETELNSILNEAMYNAIDYTMQKILEENTDLIEKYVYGAYSPILYPRTKEFLRSWSILSKKSSGLKNGPSGEFYYNPDIMEYDSSLGQHGTPDTYYGQTSDWWNSVKAEWGDAREYLADIIYGGKSSHIFGDGEWTKKRDAWSQLVKKLSQGKIFSWFEEGMANQGLKVYKR